MEEIHVCWKSNAIGGDPSFSRVTYTGGYSYKLIVKDYSLASRTSLPEIVSIYPQRGSSEVYGTDVDLQITFESETVTPAARSGSDGKIYVYRGAVNYEGDIEMITSNPLVAITTLDSADGLTNGVLACTSSGTCNITISTATSNPMVAGEIYFLALYENSFSNNVAGNSYLFANTSNSGSPIYTSMFVSRSFNILDDSTRSIFGNELIIEGENLKEIVNINRKESYGAIANDTFETYKIKISLKITSTTCSSSLLPFASINMNDVNSTHISIYNLDLKSCDNGQVEADFEVTRGIRTGLNTWGYMFTEYQKDVILGQIVFDI